MIDRSTHLCLREFLLSIVLLSLPQAVIAVPNFNIGRYQTSTKKCSYTDSNQNTIACRELQLNKRSASVVGVHFISAGKTKDSRKQLTFVTLTTQGTIPLLCNHGSCRMDDSPWKSAVSSVAEASFNSNGIATGLPRSLHVSKGHCKLTNKILSCIAHRPNGDKFKAEAQL